jgi:hypothetical protein
MKRWQKTKGAAIAIALALVAWGGYRAYGAYQWAKVGLVRSHEVYSVLAGPVLLPDGQRVLQVKDAKTGRVVNVSLTEILARLAAERAQLMVEAPIVGPKKE